MQVQVNGLTVLPAHEDGERSMAYSMRMKVAVKAADGQVTSHPGVVTVTVLHVRAKLFCTYVNGGENDLDWSRQTAREWAAAIVAANPSDTATSAKEARRAPGFDWNGVGRTAFIGGVIGGAVGLIRLRWGRKKPANTPSAFP